jgi:DNA-binding transcriptional LysR family regulator
MADGKTSSRRATAQPEFSREDRNRIELRHLRYFVAVAEEGNVSRAALRLGIAQPPLSQQIKQLENWLQVRLFHRNARGVDLTPAAQDFLEQARAILEKMDVAIDSVRHAEWGGDFHLGCVYSVNFLFGAAISRVAGDHFPRLRLHFLEMSANEQAKALLDGVIDAGVMRFPISDNRVRIRVLFESPLVVALPVDHASTRRAKISLRDIEAINGAAPGVGLSLSFRQQTADIFKRKGLAPRGLRAISDIGLLMELVEAGMGAALVPSCIRAASYPKAVFKPLVDATPPLMVYFAWRTDTLTPLRAAFVRLMTRQTWKSFVD